MKNKLLIFILLMATIMANNYVFANYKDPNTTSEQNPDYAYLRSEIGQAQTTNYVITGLNIKQSRSLMSEALLVTNAAKYGEFIFLIDRLYPPMLELAGGRSIVMRLVSSFPVSFLKRMRTALGKPSKLYIYDSKEIVFIPTNNFLDEKLMAIDFMLSIRDVGENEWSFLQIPHVSAITNVFKFFPEMDKKMNFPPIKSFL